MMRLVLFKEKTPENFPSQWYEDSDKAAVCKPRRELSPENDHADSLMLDLASRTVKEYISTA